MKRLEGITILVAGASSGFGAAAISLLSKEGAKVISAARRENCGLALAAIPARKKQSLRVGYLIPTNRRKSPYGRYPTSPLS